MATATPWYLTPDALAAIASIEVRPEAELVRDTLSDQSQLCYVGAGVDALERCFVANAVAPVTVFPEDVLAALFGPADPSRVFADDAAKWEAVRQEIAFTKFDAARDAVRVAA